ncbi:hypothetical protein [Elizabethkingia miricola]
MSTLFGTKALESAPVKVDGSIPEDEKFTELCKTYRNSVEFVDDDPNVQDEFSDQDDDPIESLVEPGATNGKFSTFQFDTATLQKLFPTGTVVDSAFTFGKNLGFVTALRFKTDSGHQITYPKVKVIAKKNLKLVRNGIALIDCTVKVLSQPQLKKLP